MFVKFSVVPESFTTKKKKGKGKSEKGIILILHKVIELYDSLAYVAKGSSLSQFVVNSHMSVKQIFVCKTSGTHSAAEGLSFLVLPFVDEYLETFS